MKITTQINLITEIEIENIKEIKQQKENKDTPPWIKNRRETTERTINKNILNKSEITNMGYSIPKNDITSEIRDHVVTKITNELAKSGLTIKIKEIIMTPTKGLNTKDKIINPVLLALTELQQNYHEKYIK